MCTRTFRDSLSNGFEGMVNQIYAAELQLKKANISDNNASFLIYIYQFWTDLFHLKTMTNTMILLSILLIFQFRR